MIMTSQLFWGIWVTMASETREDQKVNREMPVTFGPFSWSKGVLTIRKTQKTKDFSRVLVPSELKEQ